MEINEAGQPVGLSRSHSELSRDSCLKDEDQSQRQEIVEQPNREKINIVAVDCGIIQRQGLVSFSSPITTKKQRVADDPQVMNNPEGENLQI